MTKEVKIMKYEKPEITALADAICAIQVVGPKSHPSDEDGPKELPISCYEDAE